MIEAGRSRFLSCSLALILALTACSAKGPLPDPLTGEVRDVEPDDATGHTQLEEFFANGARCNEILLRSPYVEEFLLAILSTVTIDLEPPYDENAVLEVTLGTVGHVERLRLKSVSSPSIEAPFRLLVEAPPPLPHAPRDVHACLGAKPFPFIVKVIKAFQCLEQEAYLAYQREVETDLYEILYSRGFSDTPGRGWVGVNLTLDSEGHVRDTQIRGTPDPLAVRKIEAAIKRNGRFPAPPEFSRCFAEKPLRLRLEAQGE